MSRKTHMILNSILVMLLAAMVSGTFVVAIWITDRITPVTVQKTTLATPVVKPGGYIVIDQNIDYERDCAGHIDRWLYDSGQFKNRRQLEDIDYSTPPDGLGNKTLKTRERVPEDFVDGPAYYVASPRYFCNWVHRMFWPIARPSTIVEFQVRR